MILLIDVSSSRYGFIIYFIVKYLAFSVSYHVLSVLSRATKRPDDQQSPKCLVSQARSNQLQRRLLSPCMTLNVIDAGLLGSGLWDCKVWGQPRKWSLVLATQDMHQTTWSNNTTKNWYGTMAVVYRELEQQHYRQLVRYYAEPSHSKSQQKYQAWKCPLELEREPP